MPQIFIANPKGGCGKTTLATQLAGYFADKKANVLLLDHDAQRSSHDWLQNRPAACSPIALEIFGDSNSQPDADQLLIHDMPAACGIDDFMSQINPGDYLIIPVLPSPTDIKACLRFVMALYRFGFLQKELSIGLVANRVKLRTVYFKTLESFLQRLQLPLIATLRDSQNYIRVMDAGLTIFDLPPSRSKTDRDQWQALLDWLEADTLIERYPIRDRSKQHLLQSA